MDNLSDSYDLHEREWDSYEQIHEEFEWVVPDSFNAGRFLCDRWATDEGKVALIYEDRTADVQGTHTFGELRTLTNRLANRFEAAGLERGDRLGVNVLRKREALISYLAAWKAGLVPVPLSTLFGPDGLRYRIEDSGTRLGVVDESNLDNYREATADNETIDRTFVVGDVSLREDEREFWDELRSGSTAYEVTETRAEDDLLLMYTSGTTGEPKGVLHAHRAVIGHLPGAITSYYNLEVQDEIWWTPVEYSWAGTLSAIVGTWAYGSTLVAFETGESFDPHEAFSLLDRYDVTLCRIPPSGLRMMMNVEDPAEEYDLSAMRIVGSGGESLGVPIREWAGETFDASVHEGYGQTELWNLIAGDISALDEPRPGWFGRPHPGHDMEIIDPDEPEPLEPGEVGEIALQRDDPVVLKEYWNKPEKTEEKFAGDWVRTGDMGERTEDGWFKHLGRKDDVIISSGYRISPAEVESSLVTHDAVVESGVVGVDDDERGTVPKAFVVLDDGAAASDELKSALQTHVRERLAAYEYPRHVEFVDELPKTTTGKLRRTELRERESNGN